MKTLILLRPNSPWSPGTQERRSALKAQGWELIEIPLLDIRSTLQVEDLGLALSTLDSNDWIAFSSRNAIHAIFEKGVEIFQNRSLKFAVVGEKTAQALQSFGFNADLQARSETAAGLGAELAERVIDSNVLFLRGSIVSGELKEALIEKVAGYQELIVYEALRRDVRAEERLLILDQLRNESSVFAFTHGESVRAFRELVQIELGETESRRLFASARFAVIGRETAKVLSETGVEAAAIAGRTSLESLIETSVKLIGEAVC